MNRWWLSISTTAYVVLMSLAAYSCLDSESYTEAGLFLLFAFLFPLLTENMRDRLLRKSSGQGKSVVEDSEKDLA